MIQNASKDDFEDKPDGPIVVTVFSESFLGESERSSG